MSAGARGGTRESYAPARVRQDLFPGPRSTTSVARIDYPCEEPLEEVLRRALRQVLRLKKAS